MVCSYSYFCFPPLLTVVESGRCDPPFVVRSWWPLLSTWRANVPHDWWTDHWDVFFEDRLKDLEDGNAMPLTQREWRNKLRANGLIKRITRNIEKHSVAFLNTVVNGQRPGLS